MILSKKIAVVLPAYNAAKTLAKTIDEVKAQGCVDDIILVDDASRDSTADLASSIPGVRVFRHPANRGYGGNQKTCYKTALDAGADIVVMVHPDYQYTPRLIPAMASMIASGLYPAVLASRILGGGALAGGMPVWKYVSNRFLTAAMNLLMGAKLSEYHTGLPGLLRRPPPPPPPRIQLRRLRLRLPDARPNPLSPRNHRGNLLPHRLLPRSLLHQLPPLLRLRLRVPRRLPPLPPRPLAPRHPPRLIFSRLKPAAS